METKSLSRPARILSTPAHSLEQARQRLDLAQKRKRSRPHVNQPLNRLGPGDYERCWQQPSQLKDSYQLTHKQKTCCQWCSAVRPPWCWEAVKLKHQQKGSKYTANVNEEAIGNRNAGKKTGSERCTRQIDYKNKTGSQRKKSHKARTGKQTQHGQGMGKRSTLRNTGQKPTITL